MSCSSHLLHVFIVWPWPHFVLVDVIVHFICTKHLTVCTWLLYLMSGVSQMSRPCCGLTLFCVCCLHLCVFIYCYRVTACNTTHSIAFTILSTCRLSDECIVTKRNKSFISISTPYEMDISSLSSPTGVAGYCPFHPKCLPKVTHQV